MKTILALRALTIVYASKLSEQLSLKNTMDQPPPWAGKQGVARMFAEYRALSKAVAAGQLFGVREVSCTRAHIVNLALSRRAAAAAAAA